jgi:DNA-directed RNA polymerase specialized sigma24 family protein
VEIATGSPTESASDAALLEEIYPRLRRFAAVAADWDIDPDDLVQEAVCRALARGPLRDLKAPYPYLCRAIMNLVANERRRASRSRHAAARTNADDRAVVAYPSDLAVLFELSPLDRTVLFMADVEGAPLPEIAVSLGLSTVAVRHRASRARRALRRKMESP